MLPLTWPEPPARSPSALVREPQFAPLRGRKHDPSPGTAAQMSHLVAFSKNYFLIVVKKKKKKKYNIEFTVKTISKYIIQ